jgi:hypothetical protein
MLIARQGAAPVQLIKTTHGLIDALEAAEFQNRGVKNIAAYRIGCAVVKEGRTTFVEGPWMNVPQSISPGAVQTVPAQAIRLDDQAQEMIFFVSDLRYVDGTRWKADRRKLVHLKTVEQHRYGH